MRHQAVSSAGRSQLLQRYRFGRGLQEMKNGHLNHYAALRGICVIHAERVCAPIGVVIQECQAMAAPPGVVPLARQVLKGALRQA